MDNPCLLVTYGTVIESIAIVVLVGVTIFYAYQTRRMAKEMEAARFDAVRPLITIEKTEAKQRGDILKQTADAFRIKEGKFPESVKCEIRNVGLGPALNLKYCLKYEAMNSIEKERLVLAVGESDTLHFLLEDEADDKRVIGIKYQDAFGRRFESLLWITMDESNARLVSRLEIRGNRKG